MTVRCQAPSKIRTPELLAPRRRYVSRMRIWTTSELPKPLAGYGAAAALPGAALLVWRISPVMHQNPFVLFVAAVIISARFFRFGPGGFSSVLSAVLIDYGVFPPHFE